jgi:NAD(P)-dependent dehydrogenase (short-subunit alcohol dehydrogenase family)
MISIVVGGKTGIGKSIVEVLRSRGDQVYTFSRRKSKDENHTSIDLSSKTSIKKIEDLIGERLINNLIFCHRYRGVNKKREYEITVEAVGEVIETLKDKFKKNSSIVLLGSSASNLIFDEQPVEYHTSRAALESLMRYYAERLGAKGIRCNCVLLGTLIKEENKNFFTEDNPVTKLIKEITPLNNIGHSIDIANLVEFLCSQKSSFISGQSINVDGGLTLVAQESIARRLKELKHD